MGSNSEADWHSRLNTLKYDGRVLLISPFVTQGGLLA
jgi:hypothetical protein